MGESNIGNAADVAKTVGAGTVEEIKHVIHIDDPLYFSFLHQHVVS